MFGRYYRRLKWLFWGEVSRMLVEDYESPADAIVLPLLALSASVSMLWTAVSIDRLVDATVWLFPAAIIGFLGALAMGMSVLVAAASVVYATRTAEVDRPMEVHDGRA
jgi:hypothetical protein